ncbi:MAG: helix-turn-helix domain-containing protein [Thermodesulfobacteriota bacterium]|nr:helix-turn-helix domain-containing protein [Thermodesulfobacteriota bacterium]
MLQINYNVLRQKPPMANKRPEYYSTTLEKGLRILNLFDEDHSHWSQKEIAEVMGMNTISVCRLVNTFVEMGSLSKEGKTRQLQQRCI